MAPPYVSFMMSSAPQLVASYDGFKVLKLPYRRGKDPRKFSMYIFLPDARGGLWELEEEMISDSGFLDSHIPKEAVPVRDLKIPVGIRGTIVCKALGLALPPIEEVDPDILLILYSSSRLSIVQAVGKGSNVRW